MNNYLLVGAGGTGTILAPHLLRQLHKVHGNEFCLFIIDGDQIEDANLTRQDYRPEDVGHYKADVLACKLAHVNDPVNLPDFLEAQNVYIEESTVDILLGEGDTIFIAVDNFRARGDIERKALTLRNVTVVNGGNEATTASCQIFIRRDGENITPPLSYQHPEILIQEAPRSAENCMVRAASHDDEQTIAANLLSAGWMLAALAHVQRVEALGDNLVTIIPDEANTLNTPYLMWHELHADIDKGKAGGIDWREISDHWRTYTPPAQEATA